VAKARLYCWLAVFAIGFHPGAAAQVYGSLSLGPAKVQDLNFRDRATADLLLDAGTAWHLSGAIGYRFSPAIRAELNLGYLDGSATGTFRQNIITIAACGITPSQPCLDARVRSDIKGKTALAMGYLDFPANGALTPFIGLGAGLGRQSLDVVGTARTTGTGPGTPFTVIYGGATSFAYRATAGLSFDFGPVAADLAYAYTRMGKPDLDARGAFVFFTFDRPLKVHALTATARFAF
jgi:opacity protein-like surface antigen